MSDIYDHPELGAFTWEDGIESWVRTIAIKFEGREEELPVHLVLSEHSTPTPAQAELAGEIVGGLLEKRWPEVRQRAMCPPTEFANEWEFEARRAHTSIIIYAHRRMWSVQAFLDAVDGTPADVFNDLPLDFDFIEEEPSETHLGN